MNQTGKEMTSDDKGWFAVRVIIEAVHSPPSDRRLVEDRIIVVIAANEDEARETATALTKSAEGTTYQSASGDQVTWQFREVFDVKPISDDPGQHGSEIYYTFLYEDELDQIRAFGKSD